MTQQHRPHRFPPLSQLGAGGVLPPGAGVHAQASLAEAFQQGLDRGWREGYEGGQQRGLEEGHAEGRAAGLAAGREEALAEARAGFETLARPLDSLLSQLQQLQHDYQTAMRKEVVELVARVARQVIRCELALQPVQLLSLVDETLATMPPVREGVEVYLNPEEAQRIAELDPERARRWTLIPDPRLEAGECRVKADGREADAGCRQRLAASMDQIAAQLLPGTAAGEAA
ncbi:flagellar assembly protein FliH [Aquabacterium sp. A7-Y]|uniref:flagellar assembly protein FliH n=1 Tax=Aquabacterium sp. A7-Y TaxID=1349605 RepID=UPI00223E332C|nr:flagellar assembly protein FliH [Aquabacterium sp. A7-Y]MCW7536520.1 flagellar assembly protein FliH [Aquabacterium sp. A7-Y]